VPLPNIAVGHLDPAGRLLHPHLIWLLADAVALTSKGRQGPKLLYRAVLDALTAGLLLVGADPNGRANALRVKNPLGPAWSNAILAGSGLAIAATNSHGCRRRSESRPMERRHGGAAAE
jgi:hypothetical protein